MYHSDLSGERLDAEAWESRVNRIESNRIESRCVAVVSGTLSKIAMLDENHATRGRGLLLFVTDPGHVYF